MSAMKDAMAGRLDVMFRLMLKPAMVAQPTPHMRLGREQTIVVVSFILAQVEREPKQHVRRIEEQLRCSCLRGELEEASLPASADQSGCADSPGFLRGVAQQSTQSILIWLCGIPA